MIRIGDFSRLSRVSVKTLRYYDELGLIKPAHVDQFTGYRYYLHDQYPRISRILALRDLGFSLEQIARLLDAGLSATQMRGMLELRRAEIGQRIDEEEGRFARIETWLRQIGREDSMSEYEVVVKRVEAVKVASVRGMIPTPPEQGLLWQKLETYLQAHQVSSSGSCITLYHDGGPKELDWDIEVCEPITTILPNSPEVKVRELDAVETMACAVYRGPFMTIGDAYSALQKWTRDHNYRVAGACREVNLHIASQENDPERLARGIGANQADPDTVVEVQFPVVKV